MFPVGEAHLSAGSGRFEIICAFSSGYLSPEHYGRLLYGKFGGSFRHLGYEGGHSLICGGDLPPQVYSGPARGETRRLETQENGCRPWVGFLGVWREEK